MQGTVGWDNVHRQQLVQLSAHKMVDVYLLYAVIVVVVAVARFRFHSSRIFGMCHHSKRHPKSSHHNCIGIWKCFRVRFHPATMEECIFTNSISVNLKKKFFESHPVANYQLPATTMPTINNTKWLHKLSIAKSFLWAVSPKTGL